MQADDDHLRPLRAAPDWAADRNVGGDTSEAAMTDEELKQAVKNVLMTLPTGDSGNYFHDDLVQAFAQAFKQQQAVGVREIAHVIAYKKRKPLLQALSARSRAYNEAIIKAVRLCEAQAKEMEA